MRFANANDNNNGVGNHDNDNDVEMWWINLAENFKHPKQQCCQYGALKCFKENSLAFNFVIFSKLTKTKFF